MIPCILLSCQKKGAKPLYACGILPVKKAGPHLAISINHEQDARATCALVLQDGARSRMNKERTAQRDLHFPSSKSSAAAATHR